MTKFSMVFFCQCLSGSRLSVLDDEGQGFTVLYRLRDAVLTTPACIIEVDEWDMIRYRMGSCRPSLLLVWKYATVPRVTSPQTLVTS